MANSPSNNNIFWGLINYEIAGDGCLNGLWNNNDPHKNGVIMNEIARKEGGDRTTIAGNYQASWIEPNRQPINASLKIFDNGMSLNFEWFVEGESISPLFKGVGMRVGLNKMVCFYWKGNENFDVGTIFTNRSN